MSAPVIVNTFAKDPSKVIESAVGFLKIAPDDKGVPQILISPDLKRIFLNRNGMVVPISDKSVLPNTIITFDVGNQNITNGSLVPPENLLKAYNDNSARTQILSNEGHIVTTSGAQFGFFSSSEDLLVVGNGSTWKMSWIMDFTTSEASSSIQAPYILNSDIVAPASAGFRSEAILIMNMEQDGTTVKFYHRTTGGSFVAFHSAINVYTPEGTSVLCSIERQASDFNFIFDDNNVISRQEASIALATPDCTYAFS